MIRDAFRLLGKDLYSDDMDFPEFMSYFRLLQTTEAPLNRILYLRQLVRDGKITKKEYKNEREEIKRIGSDIIQLKEKRSKREEREAAERRDSLRAQFSNIKVKAR
jgi:hypothetical protein